MRFSIKRAIIKKRTPERAERAYRQMVAEREAQKRETRWFNMILQMPEL